MENLQAVERTPLRVQIRRSLTEAILSGRLPPGDRVNETTLAEQLGVSQTPVREALLGLEGRGFLSSRPGRGFFVREFSARDVRDIYPVLATLEVLALESCEPPDRAALVELDRLNGSLRRLAGAPPSCRILAFLSSPARSS